MPRSDSSRNQIIARFELACEKRTVDVSKIMSTSSGCSYYWKELLFDLLTWANELVLIYSSGQYSPYLGTVSRGSVCYRIRFWKKFCVHMKLEQNDVRWQSRAGLWQIQLHVCTNKRRLIFIVWEKLFKTTCLLRWDLTHMKKLYFEHNLKI